MSSQRKTCFSSSSVSVGFSHITLAYETFLCYIIDWIYKVTKLKAKTCKLNNSFKNKKRVIKNQLSDYRQRGDPSPKQLKITKGVLQKMCRYNLIGGFFLELISHYSHHNAPPLPQMLGRGTQDPTRTNVGTMHPVQ